MPTQAQLTAEVYWRREFAPPSLVALGSRLRTFFNVPAVNIGIKGNAAHLRGYHRSHAWIKGSRWCTNRTYSVSETPGNLNPGNDDWLSALDISLPASKLIPMCKRLDAAVRAGRLEKVTEWYGNDDGDNRVDGYDNIRNRVASSDSSHLWHAHLSFDRRRVGLDHSDLYEILTGDTMPLTNADADLIIDRLLGQQLGSSGPIVAVALQSGFRNTETILLKADEILAKPGVEPTPVDLAALVTALTPVVQSIVRQELDNTHLSS